MDPYRSTQEETKDPTRTRRCRDYVAAALTLGTLLFFGIVAAPLMTILGPVALVLTCCVFVYARLSDSVTPLGEWLWFGGLSLSALVTVLSYSRIYFTACDYTYAVCM